jgi:demethylmenaquinone methyltransferase/2-methoxy-6-polyprenyl-1,4-benzoquinol methylase
VRKFVYELNQAENHKQKAKYVEKIFDSAAPVYDLMNTVISLGLHKIWRKHSIEMLKISPGDRILDGCCGTADFAMEMVKKVGPTGKVFATDFSEQMLLKGVEKIRLSPSVNGNIKPARADTMHLPFKSNSFNAVTVAYGMRNLGNLENGLREIKRVLKKGGRFGCLDLATPVIPVYSHVYHFYFFKMVPLIGKLVSRNKDPYAYLPESLRTFLRQEDMKALMEEVGFVNVRYRNFAGGAVAFHIGEKSA